MAETRPADQTEWDSEVGQSIFLSWSMHNVKIVWFLSANEYINLKLLFFDALFVESMST